MISRILVMLIQYFPLDFMFPMRFYYKKNPRIWMSLQINYWHKKNPILLTIRDHEGKSVYPSYNNTFLFLRIFFHLIHE